MDIEKSVVAHITIHGERFEILVDPNLALEFRLGKKKDFSNVLIVEEVFKDAKKGERASSEKLKKCFGTEDVFQIAQRIIKEGEVPITTEQRRTMVEEKKKKIIAMIAREAIDPRTNAPHPPQRIEKAMEEARVHIDPLKPAESQLNDVISALKILLPLKFERAKFAVKIPADVAQRVYGAIKSFGIQNEEWLSDGSLAVVLEVPAGIQGEIFDRINKLTSGRAIIKDLKQK